MDQTALCRAHPGRPVRMTAVKVGVQFNFKLGERQFVIDNACSHGQVKSKPNSPQPLPRKIESTCSCIHSGLAVSSISKNPRWMKGANRTQGRLPTHPFAPVWRPRNGAVSVGTGKYRKPMDKQSSFTVLADSRKTVSGGVSDNTEDVSSPRWEFLKNLKHRLVRDIAYVVASPSLLQDSDELPLVSSGMLGGDDNDWSQNASWLKQLDAESLESWFGARPTRHRLGDHFALCVEYVLRFLPTAHIHNLVASQQVTEQILAAGELIPAAISPQAPQDILLGTNDGQGGKAAGHKVVMADEDNSEHVVRRKRQMRRKLQRDAFLDIPRTIGEFDFLFQLKPREVLNTGQRAADIEEDYSPQKLNEECQMRTGGSLTRELDTLALYARHIVQHWEVSVKFLLYTGPWEPFGLLTPTDASWSNIKQNQEIIDSGTAGAGADTDDDEEYGDEEEEEEEEHLTFLTRAETETVMPDSNLLRTPDSDTLDDGDKFLGCFLGPHMGESLVQRKEKLCVQLALSGRPEAAAMIYNLFPGEAKEGDTNEVEPKQQPEVNPRALLNGYLFYEFNLWLILRHKQGNLDVYIHDKTRSPGDGGIEPSSGAILNRRHWMGWWCHINEFIHFPFARDRRWYILPKLEWLPPVVIEGSDAGRCALVLDMSRLREALDKLAAQATQTGKPTKNRVLLAEVCWEWISEDCQSGRWVEANRGFIVEKTWPDCKLYKPHGFDMSWSPTLVTPFV